MSKYSEQIDTVKKYAKKHKLIFKMGALSKPTKTVFFLAKSPPKGSKVISIGCERNWGQSQSIIYFN